MTNSPDPAPQQEQPARRCAGCNKSRRCKFTETDGAIWPDGRARLLCRTCLHALRTSHVPSIVYSVGVPPECLP